MQRQDLQYPPKLASNIQAKFEIISHEIPLCAAGHDSQKQGHAQKIHASAISDSLQLSEHTTFLDKMPVWYEEQVNAVIVNGWKQGIKHNSAYLFNHPVQR